MQALCMNKMDACVCKYSMFVCLCMKFPVQIPFSERFPPSKCFYSIAVFRERACVETTHTRLPDFFLLCSSHLNFRMSTRLIHTHTHTLTHIHYDARIHTHVYVHVYVLDSLSRRVDDVLAAARH